MDAQTPEPASPPPPEPTVSWAASPPPPERRQGFNWGDFFAFRYMITPVVIKVIYIIGAVLISLGSILYLVPSGGGGGGLLVALLALLLGNIYWRVIMELLIVFFGIHESLRAIERRDRH